MRKFGEVVSFEVHQAGFEAHQAASKALPAGSEALSAGSKPLPVGSKPLLAGSEPLPVGSKLLPAGSEALPLSLVTVFVSYGAAAQFNFNETSEAEETADRVTLLRLFTISSISLYTVHDWSKRKGQ